VQVLADELESPGGLAAQPLLAQEVQRLITAGLLWGQPHSYYDELREPGRALRPRTIKLVVDAIEARPEYPWTAREMAQLTGVGVRSVEDGFRRHLGDSPTAYLRRCRLERVRAELAAAGPGEVTVAEVAHRWGFSHLGPLRPGLPRAVRGAPLGDAALLTPPSGVRPHGAAAETCALRSQATPTVGGAAPNAEPETEAAVRKPRGVPGADPSSAVEPEVCPLTDQENPNAAIATASHQNTGRSSGRVADLGCDAGRSTIAGTVIGLCSSGSSWSGGGGVEAVQLIGEGWFAPGDGSNGLGSCRRRGAA
jgi:AraC-like DNA-binding protein